MNKIKELYKRMRPIVLQKMESFRLKVSTHPKIILLRLRLFGIHPFLGNHFIKIAGITIVCLFFYSVFYVSFWRAPLSFPDQALITIERGESLGQIADSFEDKNAIISSLWLKVFVMFWGGQNRVVAGDYYFSEPVSVFTVARKISRGEFGLITLKITVPEGTSSYEMAKILERELPAFNSDDFLDEVERGNYEGYLFPDTYFFTSNTKADTVILTMRENFARQIKDYEEDILKLDKPFEDIVIVASLVEDEANRSLDSKRIVAGIIWKRLREKMPLQVDAPFVYYNGKNSYTLTKDDLAEDHEYNTYVNKGLPPTAITNPGIDSLRAAIAPTNTDYFYFMSDRSGNMYYARNFEEHKRNRELHLN